MKKRRSSSFKYLHRGLFQGMGFALGACILAGGLLWAQSALNQFSAGDLISAADINANFTTLNQDLTAVKTDLMAPVGSIVAWHKNADPGSPLSIPAGWVECNGGSVSDSESVLNGQPIPDLNGQARFLRGAASSGGFQDDAFQGHRHHLTKVTNVLELRNVAPSGFHAIGPGNQDVSNFSSTAHYNVMDPITDGSNGTPRTAVETRPTNMAVVWIMRVK